MLYELKSIWREREKRKMFEKFKMFLWNFNVFQLIKNCILILKCDKFFYVLLLERNLT